MGGTIETIAAILVVAVLGLAARVGLARGLLRLGRYVRGRVGVAERLPYDQNWLGVGLAIFFVAFAVFAFTMRVGPGAHAWHLVGLVMAGLATAGASFVAMWWFLAGRTAHDGEPGAAD